jgi:hypothetical protein
MKRLEARVQAKLAVARDINATEPSRESLSPHTKRKESPSLRTRARQYFGKTISTTKVLASLLLTGLALIGYYARFRPNVSVDPERSLNPGDPFSTQFSVKNDSPVFSVKDFHPSCYTIRVITDHNFAMLGLPPLPTPSIHLLEPGQKTTITCQGWVGSLGSGAGNVVTALIEIDVSYKQDWWPFRSTQRFPLKGVIDSQKIVYWTHITPAELESSLSGQRRLPR